VVVPTITLGQYMTVLAVANTVAQVAITAGVTAAATALSKPKVAASGGMATDVRLDPQAPIPYVVGRTKVGGNVVYSTTTGAKNKYLLFYRVLSGGGPHEAFESFLANDVAITFGTDGGEGATGTYQNRMWMRRALDGGAAAYGGLRFTATGTKDTPADHDGNPYEWTTAHRMSGYAVSLLGVEFDAVKFSGGPPKPADVMKGAKVYDPRLDSTYPGGSGAHRWADPSDATAFAAAQATWTWSENPYVHALNWVLGRWSRAGSSPYRRVLGIGAPIGMVLVDQFVEGANVADANGWTVGGVSYSGDGKWEVLASYLQAGGGEPMRLGAKIGCFVNSPRVSIATLTGADFGVGEISIPGGASRRDRINRVIPRYRSEAHAWEVVSGDPVLVDAYVTADGGTWRTREMDLPMVQDKDQAAQLAALAIVNAREFGPGTVPLKPRWMGLKPGDCITINEPAVNLTGQTVTIRSRSLDPKSATRSITFVSETAGKYDYVLGRTGTAPPIPSLTAPDLTPATPDAANWSATGGQQSGAGGKAPVIVISGEIDDVHASAVIIDYRQDLGGGTYGLWASREWPAGSLASGADPTVSLELTGLAPGAPYQVRVRYRTIRGVEDPATYLDLGSVTAGALRAGTIVGQTAWATYTASIGSIVTPGANLVFDGGLRLNAKGWGGFGSSGWEAFTSSGDIGPFITASASAAYAISPRFKVAPSTPYVAQTFAAAQVGTRSGLPGIYIDWHDAADVYIGTVPARTDIPADGVYARRTVTGISPAGAAYGRVVLYSGAHSGFLGVYASKIKCEIGSEPTVFSDETTNGALYDSGVDINSLKPAEIGANVTETRTAAAIAGQGALATLNEATWATHVTGVGKPEDYATKSLVYRQSTTPSSPSVNDIWVRLNSGGGYPEAVLAWNGSAWIGAADVTSLNTAAAIAGQGALATLNEATWATHVTGVGKPEDYATKSLVYRQSTTPSSPGLNDIWVKLNATSGTPEAVYAWNGTAWVSAADITALNTAAGVTGQGPLATVTPPSFAGNAAALAGGLLPGALFTDTSDSNKIKGVVAVVVPPTALSDTDTVPSSGSSQDTIATSASATFEAGGSFRVSGAVSGTVNGSGNSSIFTLRIKVTYGGTTTTLATVNCVIADDGTVVTDGLLALAGQLFSNPGSGAATFTITRQRGGPSNGATSSFDINALIEWVA
jgi:hypothetical protein